MSARTRQQRTLLLRFVALLAVIAFVGAACGGGGGGNKGTTGNQNAQTDAGKPQTGGTVTMGLEAETNQWLPGKGAIANAGSNVTLAIFDPYIMRSEKGEVKPYLAESLTPNADLTEWTMKLRSGVKFHDGTDFNADSVKWNFDTLANAPGSNVAGSIKNFQVKEVKVVDPLTVTYVLGQGNAAFPDLLTGTVGEPFSRAAYEKNPADAGSNPVGTGPFKFVSWQKDSQLVAEKNPNYWQKGKPYLDKIVFRPIPDEDTRFQSLLSGDINAFQTLRQSIVKQAIDKSKESGSPIKINQYIGDNGGGAIFNAKRAPVDDQRVREGLAWAMNQQALVEVLGGVEVAGIRNQYFNENSKWYSDKAAKAWPNNNVTKAKTLLDSYKNDPKRSDGKAVGSPISVDFNCPPDPSLIELSQLYQQEWQAVGVQVKLNQVEQAAHIQNAIKDDFMINCWRMGGDADPYTTLSDAFGDPASHPLNFTNYTSADVQKNIEVLRSSRDDAERKKAVEDIMLEFDKQVPNVWTGGTPTIVGFAKNVNGVTKWTYPDGSNGGGQTSGVLRPADLWIKK